MTAATTERMRSLAEYGYINATLASGKIGYAGTLAFWDNAGNVVPAAGSGLVFAGIFDKTYDASSGAVACRLQIVQGAIWCENDGNITTSHVGRAAYAIDNQTVGLAGSARSELGTILAVDSIRGVLVKPFAQSDTLEVGSTLAFSSNDIAISPASGVIYDVPTAAAASTISLQTPTRNGIVAYFSADGTKNGFTITYRDGTTAISAALTASKRHLTQVVSNGGKWFCNPVVAP